MPYLTDYKDRWMCLYFFASLRYSVTNSIETYRKITYTKRSKLKMLTSFSKRIGIEKRGEYC